MKKITVFAAAAIVAAGLAQIANAADAQPFQLTLPTGFGTFASKAQTAKDQNGKDIQITNWISKSPTSEAIVVTVTKMWAKIANPNLQMASMRDAVIKSVPNATLDSQQKLDGSTPAMTFDFHSGTAVFLRAKLMVKGDSMYQLLYVGRTPDERANPSVESMFQSFVINAPQASAATAPVAPTAPTSVAPTTSH